MLFKRCDGDLVEHLDTERWMIQFMMKGRTDSFVLLDQQVDVTRTLAYLDKVNAGQEKKTLSFFHIVLCAAARALAARPKLNRFSIGNRVYQRKKMEFTFVIKKSLSDDGLSTVKKLQFFPDDTLDTVVKRIDDAVKSGRSTKNTSSEDKMAVLKKMPAFMMRFLVWLYNKLDFYNLLPSSLIEDDELYTSIFFANLGSVGLDAPYHHMFEWGTAPLFGAIGRIHKAPVVDENGQVVARDVCSFKWSFDDRINDGFYCARGLEYFTKLLADPSQLERKPEPKPELKAEAAPPVQSAA